MFDWQGGDLAHLYFEFFFFEQVPESSLNLHLCFLSTISDKIP